MGSYLIVANQTLGAEELERTIHERVDEGGGHFFVVVPMTAPRHEVAEWDRGFTVGGSEVLPSEAAGRFMEEDARRREAELEEARRRSQGRLDRMIDEIRSAGGEAEGTVGPADPVAAVKDVLERRSFDEVIVSTLPTHLSRWLRMDLPSRIERMTDVPVTTVEAER